MALPLPLAGTACAENYTISGKVTLSDSTPMQGVRISATTDTGSETFVAYTAADGTYSFLLSSDYDYYLYSSSASYSFDPSSRLVMLHWDQPDQDFLAKPLPVQAIPGSGVKDSVVPVIVTGANFGSDSAVSLTRSGHSDIPATDITVVNSSKITCSLPLSGAATGQWNLTVSGGEQTGTSKGAFTVALSSNTRQWYGTEAYPGHSNASVAALYTGRVLVAGGDYSSVFSDAKLFDPETNTWSAAASMPTEFHNQAVTTLPDGRVIMCGGNGSDATDTGGQTVVIYDPNGNSWEAVSTLNTGRTNASAITLLDGRVLVSGGVDSSGNQLDSAEVYDAPSWTWSDLPNMPTPRSGHKALLLPNGKAMVSRSPDGETEIVDIYDPDEDSWATTSMSAARTNMTMTLLRAGKVLVAGGGGASPTTAEIYDPATGIWTAGGNLKTTVSDASSILLPDGRVLILGSNASMAQIYDPDTNSWNYTEGFAASGAVPVLLSNGRVLLARHTDSPINAPVAQVSGNVTLNAAAMPGALLSVSGSTTTSASSAANGTYSINLPLGGNYTITPSSNSYTFTPASVSSSTFVADMAQNFASTYTPTTFTASGNITLGGNPMPGVTVSVSGGATTSATTDSSGNYSFTLDAAGNYTLTPSKANYTFAPVNASTTSLSANWTQNFTASTITYTTSGNITLGGNPMPGVTVSVSGGATTSATTDSSGNYSFTLDAAGIYTLTPSKANYTFSPVSASTTSLSANWTQNFTASTVTYTASGNITLGGNPMSGVTVSLSGSASASATSDSSGNYSFTLVSGGNYTVTPSMANYAFSPVSVSTTALAGNWANNFTASTNTFTTSGTITLGGNPMPDVTVSLTGSASGSANTDANGNYSFTLSAGGNYTVTPSKTNYSFSPVSASTTSLAANWAQNFTASTNTFTASGNITLGGNPMSGVTVALSGSSSASATTDSNGNYSFTLNAGGSYTLTPSKANYVFSPVSVSTTSLAANWTGNFSAATAQYTAHGMATLGATPLIGITITLTGSSSGSATTDSNGNYSFTLNAGGNYTLTPSDPNYTFSPVSASTSAMAGIWTSNFNAVVSGYTFSGTIKKAGAGLASVAVQLSGSASASANTDANGDYSFTGLAAGGNYTVTPSSSGYLFTPASISTASMSGNLPAQNFSAVIAYVLSGTIRHNGMPAPGVTVSITDGASMAVYARGTIATTTTDSNGYFSANVLPGGSYVVTPAKSGMVFWPSYYTLPNVNQNTPNKDFSSNAQTSLDGIVVQGWDNGYVEPKKGPGVIKLNNPSETGHVTVRIYTLRKARLVRTLETDVTAATPASISWDGANTDGETVGSGVYVMTVNGAGYNNEKVKFGVLK